MVDARRLPEPAGRHPDDLAHEAEQHGGGDDVVDGELPRDEAGEPVPVVPAAHYMCGGVAVDIDARSDLPGLFVIGEANFSDHGANRLGASALMQGLADGYFVLPYTIGDYLSDDIRTGPISTDSEAFAKTEAEVRERLQKLLDAKGKNPVDYYHKKLGKIIMMRDAPDHTKEDWVFLSGTKVRIMLSEGKDLPVEFSRPEVAEILMKYYQSEAAGECHCHGGGDDAAAIGGAATIIADRVHAASDFAQVVFVQGHGRGCTADM